MKRTKKRDGKTGVRAFAVRPVACCIILAFSGAASANPTGPSVAAGSATFNTAGKTLSVTNAPGTIINWQGFSIGSGEATRFIQQSSMSAVLNRVVGNDASSLLGTLSSNGRVFLVNPHGIVFGAGSVIDTAGFIASTLNIADRDFLQGKLKFEGGGNGLLRNEGNIKASGDIMLVGPRIENAGVIRSEHGNVLLAAGQKVTITSPDAQGVRFEMQAPTDSALNMGTIEAASSVRMFAGTLHHSGDIRATGSTVSEGGTVSLVALKDAIVDKGATVTVSDANGGNVTIQSGDLTRVAGHVDATGTAGRGGDVQILGNRVALESTAVVDASGETGGGTILVGGDYQGKNPDVRNAWRTNVAPDATLKADAVTSGDGGKVIVWADDTTRFYGNISARGGAQSGDGGFVETSGKEHLSVIGAHVDTSAPAGRAGNWLLDPKFVIVQVAGPAALNQVDDFSDNPTNPEFIDPGTINGAASNVRLQANTDITFSSPISMSGAGVGLTAQAGRSIDVNADIATNNGTISLIANETTANGVVALQRDAGGARIAMAPGTQITAGSANVFLRVADGAGHVGTSDDIVLANVSGGNVSVFHDGPTANSKILRAAPVLGVEPLVSATNSVLLALNNPAGAAGSVGTAGSPIRVSTPNLEAYTRNSAGGVFIESPGPGVLQIGGVPASIYAGDIRGVQTRAGGDIGISAVGGITRFQGSLATCGTGGGTGGPICAVGGNVTLTGASLGTAGAGGRLYVAGNLITATTTAGDMFLRERGGDATLDRYTFVPAAGRSVELANLDGDIVANANVSLPGSAFSLVSTGGREIRFVGPVTIDAASLLLTSADVVRFQNGPATINAPATIDSPVTIAGTGNATFNGGLSLTGSPLTIGGGRTLTLGSAATNTLTGVTVNNSGTIALAGTGNLVLNGGTVVNNNGLFDVQNDADLSHTAGADPTFNNAVTFRKSATGGTTSINLAPSAFANSGTIELNAGGLSMAPGNFPTNAGFIELQVGTVLTTGGPLVNNGTIGGSGTVDLAGAMLTNNNTLRPGVPGGSLGTLNFTGTLQQGPGGQVNIDVAGAGPDGSDKINVTGNVALNGTLNVEHIDGFAPPSNTIYTPIAWTGTRTGDFVTRSFPTGYEPFYTATANASNYTLALGEIVNTWNLAGGGTWQTDANWSLLHAPTAGENVLIGDLGAPGPSETITVSANPQNARSVLSNENISVTGGSLTLGTPASTINAALTLSGGALTAQGPLTANSIAVNGSSTLTLQSSVAANSIVMSGGSINVDNTTGILPRLDMSGGLLSRTAPGVSTNDLTIAGPFNLSGGFIATDSGGGRLVSAGLTTITSVGGTEPTTSRNWSNTGGLSLNGELILSGASFRNEAGAQFNVNAGGRMDLGGTQLVNDGLIVLNNSENTPFGTTAGGSILNNGVLTKAAANTVDLSLPFTNPQSGRVDVNDGILTLNLGGSQAGRIEIGSGATLSTGGASLGNDVTGVIGGSGTLNLGGAAFTNNGTVRPGNLATTSGTEAGTGTLTVNGEFFNTGNLNIGLGGQADGQFGKLVVPANPVNLSGTLNLVATPGYTATDGDTFQIITGPSVAGSFANTTTNFANGFNVLQKPTFYLIGLGGPTVNSWIFDTDGNWNDSNRWSLDHVPLATEQAYIRRPAPLTVTINPGPHAVDALHGNGTNNIELNGTLTLANPSNIDANLTMNVGAQLAGAGAVTIGSLSMNGPAADPPDISSTGGVTVTGLTGITDSALINGKLTVNQFQMNNGGTTTVVGELHFTGAADKRMGDGTATVPTLTVNGGGLVTLAGSDLKLGSGNVNILSGGRFEIQDDSSIVFAGGPAANINNAGTIAKTGGVVTASVIGDGPSVNFTNSGVLDAQVGTLAFAGTNAFNNGTTFTDSANPTIAGSNVVTANSTFNGDITSSNLTLAAGDFGGTANLNGTTVWTGGRIVGAFTVPVTGAPSLLAAAGSGAKSISGAGASLTNRGTFTIDGDGTLSVLSGAQLVNNATMTWNGGAGVIAVDGASTLTNNATLNLNASVDNTGVIGAGAFQNNGTVNAGTAGLTTVIANPLTNDNNVNVTAGALSLPGNTSGTGSYSVAGGATLAFPSGTHAVASVSGTGRVAVSGAAAAVTVTGAYAADTTDVSAGSLTTNGAYASTTTNVSGGALVTNGDFGGTTTNVSGGGILANAAYNVGTTSISGGAASFNGASTHATNTLNLSGGVLGGTGDLTVNTGGTWSGGLVSGSGAAASLTIAGGADLELTGASTTHTVSNTAVNNNGTMNVAGNLTLTDAARLTNVGALTLGGGGLTLTGNASLANSGVATWNGSATSASGIDIGAGSTVTNNAGKTFVLNAGATDTGVTGAGTFQNNGILNSNAAGVTTRIATAFANDGTTNVNAGTLQLTGNSTNAGTFAIASGATLDLPAGGTHNLNGASSVTGAGTIAMSGATVNVNGGYAAGITNISGGSANFNGATPHTTETLNLTGGTLGGTGDLTVNTAGTWSGGTVTGGSLTVGTAATFDVTGAATHTVTGAAVTNNGTLNLSGTGDVALGAGASLTNASTMNIGVAADNTAVSGAGSFRNTGTLNKGTAGVTTVIASPFANDGIANVNAGTLQLTGNSTDAGTFAIASGATLDLPAGATHNLNGASSVTGAGTIAMSGATVNVNGGYAAGITNISGGSANFNGATPHTTSTLNLTGGGLGGTGNLTVNTAGTWSGGEVNGGSLTIADPATFDLTGAATKTVNGAAVTNNGTMNVTGTGNVALGGSASLNNAGTLNLNAGSVTLANGAAVANTGTVNWNGAAPITIGGGATVTNSAGGTFELNAGANALAVTGDGTFQNNGTVNSNTAGVTTVIGSPLANDGTVNVVAGTLQLTGNSTDAGTFAIASGATLDLPAGATHNLNGPSSVTGAGTIAMSGATVNVNGGYAAGTTNLSGGTANFNGASPHTTETLNLTGGTLGGTGDLTVNTAGTWSGGTLNGANASLTIANGASFDVTGAGANVVDGAAINNSGTLNDLGDGNLALNNGARLTNSGTYNLAAGAIAMTNGATLMNAAGGIIEDNTASATPVTGPTGSFANLGTFNKNAAAAATQTIDTPLTNFGTLRVNAGTLQVAAMPSNSGTISTAAGTTFSTLGAGLVNNGTGVIEGNGTVNLGGGTLTNNGKVGSGESPGSLTIAGNYTQGPNGVLEVELGGTVQGVSYDVLRVTGNAALDGTLEVKRVNGFTESPGQNFEVMTYGSRTGDFSTINKPADSSFNPTPGPTSYVVAASAPPSGVQEQASEQASKDTVIFSERIINTLTSLDPTPTRDPEQRRVPECR